MCTKLTKGYDKLVRLWYRYQNKGIKRNIINPKGG